MKPDQGPGYRGAAGANLIRMLVLAAGAAMVLAFAPFQLAWLAPLLLAGLLLSWEGVSAAEAARRGFLFGLGLFAAGTYWLYISLNILGGLWPPLAILLMICLIVAMAAYYAATAWLTVRLVPHAGSWLRWVVAFPAAWLLFEWLRGWVLTGFPWLSVGYAFGGSLPGAWAPVGGVYAVSGIIAVLAGLLVLLLRGRLAERLLAGIAIACLLAATLALEARQWSLPDGPELRVSLVQGSVAQELKWRPEQVDPTLRLYRELSFGRERQDLVVWPEAAIPAFAFEIPEFLDELYAELIRRDTQLFTGILTYDFDRGQYFNTLWAIGPDSGMYHKRHLVAFGEYFPLPAFVRRWMRLMNLPSENITAGAPDQRPLTVAGIPVAATICYELAFGAEQLRFMPEARLLVNVSNDGWFGDSIAPHQHLQIGQMRARETGRYLLRSTNTGITALVAPDGQVLERLPQFEPGVLDFMVPPMAGTTPYVRIGNAGPVLLAVGLLLLAGLVTRRNSLESLA